MWIISFFFFIKKGKVNSKNTIGEELKAAGIKNLREGKKFTQYVTHTSSLQAVEAFMACKAKYSINMKQNSNSLYSRKRNA